MDKIENLISITEVPAGPYIIKGEFKIITKDGKENSNRNKCLMPLRSFKKQAVL